MFTKCIACDRDAKYCVLKLLLMPFPDFVAWFNKSKKELGWSNAIAATKSNTPVGTVNRISAGDDDCKYSTFQAIALTVLEGLSADFPCPELVPTVQHLELLAQQAEKLQLVEKENDELREVLASKEEQHRADIRAIRAEYQEQLADKSEQIAYYREDNKFLKEQLRAWQAR